jgi:3-methyladenine DNA glycosylase AlkD
MKSALPYYGVTMPELRRITRALAKESPVTRQDVLKIWRGATHREERYAAIELSARIALTWEDYDEMIVTGAWWDLVDPIATSRLWKLPDAKRRLRAWSTDADVWRRRAAIIAQVGRRQETDWELLQAVIAPNRADRSFWIRKAIGWALREYGKVEPDRVAAYLAETELSGLSRRVGSARLPAAPGRRAAPGRSPTRR